MASALGLGIPLLPVCRLTYPIFRLAPFSPLNNASSKPRTSFTNNIDTEWRSPLSNGTITARPHVALHAARHATGSTATIVLDLILPTSLSHLWDTLLDLDSGLLVELHRALGSEFFWIKADPAPHARDESLSGAKHLVLTYDTPLPLASLRAQNTEKVTLKPTGPSSFALSSCCSTSGVPLGNCFLNILEWEAQTEGTHSTRLRISAYTEFVVPVLGVLRSQIERESLKGIQDSYVLFSKILLQRWPTLAASRLPSISNLRTPSAMSTPIKFTHKREKVSNSSKHEKKEQRHENNEEKLAPVVVETSRSHTGSSVQRVVVVPADNISHTDAEIEGEASLSEREFHEDDEEISQPEEEEEEEDFGDLAYNEQPHRVVYLAFKEHGTLAKIKAAIEERWPAWANNRYWLLTSGAHGGNKEIDSVPTPDEAVGLLWAVGAVTAGKRIRNWPVTVPRDPLVKGLVECLRLLPARRAPQAAMSYKIFGKHNKRGISRPPPPKIDPETGVLKHVVEMPPPRAITPAALSAAMFSLGWLGGEANWMEEMEVLCKRLPDAEYRKIKEVYNVIWALRAARHWTPHLPLLEASIISMLEGFKVSGMTPRQVRHASYCAQGLVHLGYKPKQLFEELAPLVVDFFAWRGACSLAWALTIANELHSPLLPQLLRGMELHAAEVVVTGLPRRASASKIWQLIASLERMRPGYALKKTWDPDMRKLAEIAHAEWQDLVRQETKMVSAVQRDVHRSMLSMGYTADLESTACGLSVDVSIPDEKLAVEVDGFSHFARNRPDLPVGNGLWKKRLLQAHGWLVVNVNVTEWGRKRGAAEKRLFLRSAIEKQVENKLQRQAARLKKRKSWHRRHRGGGSAESHPRAALPKPKPTEIAKSS